MAEHRLDADRVHYTWSADHEPVLRIQPGDTVRVRTRDGFDGQLEGLGADALATSIDALDFARIAPLSGPVFVERAEPGDALAIEIRTLRPVGPGWAVVWPAWTEFDFHRPLGVGPRGRLWRFDPEELREGTMRIGGAHVPLRPMLGIAGTAPDVGEFTTLPPRRFGGNMDCRLLTEGATILLPVLVPGALASFGDGHAAQGDGEISTTGLECALELELRIRVEPGRRLGGPEIRTPTNHTVIEYGRDLDQAARHAIDRMHAHLVGRGIAPDDAYALLGVAGDLAINQVVDTPHPGVRLTFPIPEVER